MSPPSAIARYNVGSKSNPRISSKRNNNPSLYIKSSHLYPPLSDHSSYIKNTPSFSCGRIASRTFAFDLLTFFYELWSELEPKLCWPAHCNVPFVWTTSIKKHAPFMKLRNFSCCSPGSVFQTLEAEAAGGLDRLFNF